MPNTLSTISLQKIVNVAKIFGDIYPVLNVAGSTSEPALSAANDTAKAIFEVYFGWKWNEINLPPFYTNSYQQDYAVVYPNGKSITTLSWLQRGCVIDINNLSQPKPECGITVGRQLPRASGAWANRRIWGQVNYFPNMSLYYGLWGAANTGNGTLGNNPVAGSVYTNPVGPASMPVNPINQIQDANGNLLVLTTYGTEGTTAPLAPVNAAAGVTAAGLGATTVWTVLDPNGQGFRILPVPSQTGTVWQFNLVGQGIQPRFTSLQQFLTPIPDQFEPVFRQGFIAQCYRYSVEAKIREKFKTEWAMWIASLNEMRSSEDREQEMNSFAIGRGIYSGSASSGWPGPAWPFNGPAGR
jgi:hypothetical protein